MGPCLPELAQTTLYQGRKDCFICGDDSDSSSLDSLSDCYNDSWLDSLSDSYDDHDDDDDISGDEDSHEDSDFFFEIAFQAYETAASYHNAIKWPTSFSSSWSMVKFLSSETDIVRFSICLMMMIWMMTVINPLKIKEPKKEIGMLLWT